MTKSKHNKKGYSGSVSYLPLCPVSAFNMIDIREKAADWPRSTQLTATHLKLFPRRWFNQRHQSGRLALQNQTRYVWTVAFLQIRLLRKERTMSGTEQVWNKTAPWRNIILLDHDSLHTNTFTHMHPTLHTAIQNSVCTHYTSYTCTQTRSTHSLRRKRSVGGLGGGVVWGMKTPYDEKIAD